MKRHLRIYRVDEDDRLHRFPVARYQRVHNRVQAIHLFSGKTIRFIHVVLDQSEDGRRSVVMAEYSKCFFDAAGHLDERQRMEQLCAGAKMLDVFGQSDWEELYRHEYIKPHQWEPNEDIQAQLRLILAKGGVDF